MAVHKLKCDRLIPPKQPTYEAVGDYQVSKWLTRKFPKSAEGNDVISGNVAVSLSIAKRGLHNAEVRLKAKRQHEATQRKLLDDKWDELEVKEQELRNNFIHFNEFVKENEHKRTRALDQKEEHSKLEEQRSKKVNELLAEYQELKELKKLMDDKLEEYSVYEEFLNKTAERYPEYFSDTIGILKRYETLMHAKDFLSKKQEQDLNTLQTERRNLRDLVDGYCEKLQTMHTKLAVLTQRLESARLTCLKWDKVLMFVREQVSQKAMEIDQVRTTSSDLYEQVCHRMKHEPVYRNDIEKQLFCIRKALRDLDMVNRRIVEMRRRENEASERSVKSGGSK